MTKTGSSTAVNRVSGVCGALVSSTNEMSVINQPLMRGALFYNADTSELKVGDGVKPPSALSDHRHPNTHAPLIHSHIAGANEPWLLSNPKLWYIDDLVNHPELLPLDGREISDAQAEFISKIYPGTKLLTTEPKTLTGNGFENDDLILSTSSFSGDYVASRLFGDEITLEAISKISDQWLSSSTDIAQEQSAIVSFKGGHTYRVTEYWVCPAAGTATELFKRRPTPKDWVLEGSKDNIAWTPIDTHADEPASNWNPITTRMFTCTDMESYAFLRLRITAWNAGDSSDLQTGLRRLWIFGRKKDVFALPQLESPHPDFVYVIPQRDLNVGLKHEDIGDIGSTSLKQELLPSYRIPTDGRTLSKETNASLFTAIGHRYDSEAVISAVTVSTGTVNGTSWSTGLSDPLMPSYIELTIPSGVLGKYHIGTASTRIPKSWIVEGYNGTSWVTIQTFTGVTPEQFTAVGGIFFPEMPTTEVAYSVYRINFVEWNTGTDPIGISEVKLFSHAAGTFKVPTVITEGLTTYIVADNTAVDISTEIIQRLQSNIAALSTSVAELTNRVNELDPAIVP